MDNAVKEAVTQAVRKSAMAQASKLFPGEKNPLPTAVAAASEATNAFFTAMGDKTVVQLREHCSESLSGSNLPAEKALELVACLAAIRAMSPAEQRAETSFKPAFAPSVRAASASNTDAATTPSASTESTAGSGSAWYANTGGKFPGTGR